MFVEYCIMLDFQGAKFPWLATFGIFVEMNFADLSFS